MNKQLNLTIKLTSFQALITLSDKLASNLKQLNKQSVPEYLPYVLSEGIMSCIRIIKPDLQQRKSIQYTKMISLGIGVISSALVSVSYNGMNYVVNFTFNLLRTSGTTLIIDKLNKIKSVDGTSVAILLNLIFSIPVIIAGLSAKPLILGLLFITSLGIIAYGNYKMLQETENTNIHYKDKTDIFSLTTKNNFTTSLITSSFIAGLINNPIISTGLLFIINPLIHWFISYHNIKIDDLKKYLQQNEIYIDGLRYEKEIKAYLKKMIMNSSIKLGLVGAFVFSICSIFTQLFTIAINPIILAVFVSCFINVSFGMKAIIKSNNLNKFIKD